MKSTFRVNFINVLQATFLCPDPKSAKETDNLTVSFALSGSALIRAAQIKLMKLTPTLQKKTRTFRHAVFSRSRAFARYFSQQRSDGPWRAIFPITFLKKRRKSCYSQLKLRLTSHKSSYFENYKGASINHVCCWGGGKGSVMCDRIWE